MKVETLPRKVGEIKETEIWLCYYWATGFL